MAQGNALDALRAAANNWTQRQTVTGGLDLVQGAPSLSPPAGHAWAFLDTDNHWKIKLPDATIIDLAIQVHSQLQGNNADDHGQYPLMTGRDAEQFLTGTTRPGGRLIVRGSSDAVEPGDVLLGLAIFDGKSGFVGIGIEPQAPLHVGGAIRSENTFDPDNVALEVAHYDPAPLGSVYAGKVYMRLLETSEVVEWPVYRRSGTVPVTTGETTFPINWNVEAAPVLPADNFDRADSTLVTSSSGHVWDIRNGTWNVVSNQIRVNTASSILTVATLPDSVANRTLTVDIAQLGRAFGIVYRWDPANGAGYMLQGGTGSGAPNWRLFNWTGGYTAGAYGSALGNSGVVNAGAGQQLRMKMNGTTLEVYVNTGSGFIGTPHISLPSAGNGANTSYGLWTEQNPGSYASAAGPIWDNVILS